MSEQNIIPSAPPLYPKLNGGDYRLKKILILKKNLKMKLLITGGSARNTSGLRQ